MFKRNFRNFRSKDGHMSKVPDQDSMKKLFDDIKEWEEVGKCDCLCNYTVLSEWPLGADLVLKTMI